jgi:hypothetical protein
MAPKPKPKPSKDVKELHFYPGEHALLWMVNGKAEIRAKAWGGEEPDPKKNYEVMAPRPTTPGRYVVYSYAPYRTNTWAFSKIVWGTRLSVDPSGKQVMYATGNAKQPWANVENKIPGLTPKVIRAQYTALYGTSGKYDSNGDGIPDIWVFNDFGPWAVRYYADKNKNKKLDAGESLSGEMFHTTPDNEAEVATGQSVNLAPSHGCIHLDPTERDKLHNAGAFDRGTDVVIHSYTDKVPAGF